MIDERYDGFTINLFFDEDGEWLAHFMELPNVSAFGATAEQALSELATAWQLVKEDYRTAGEAIPSAPPRKAAMI